MSRRVGAGFWGPRFSGTALGESRPLDWDLKHFGVLPFSSQKSETRSVYGAGRVSPVGIAGRAACVIPHRALQINRLAPTVPISCAKGFAIGAPEAIQRADGGARTRREVPAVLYVLLLLSVFFVEPAVTPAVHRGAACREPHVNQRRARLEHHVHTRRAQPASSPRSLATTDSAPLD